MSKLLDKVEENLRNREVIITFVNKQNHVRDIDYLSNFVGRINKVMEDGISLSSGGVPFAGPCAAICSIRQIGDNFLFYENTVAHQVYKDKESLSKEEREAVKKMGRWYYED